MKRLSVDEAVEALQNGHLVVVPTETVYGLAADGTNFQAITQLFKLKGRPKSNPIMLQVVDEQMLERVVSEVPWQARKLIDSFWPGPLTIVLPKQPEIHEILSADTGNIGVRMPDQKLTLEIIRRVERPLAVPSANLSGYPAPRTADEVEKALFGKNVAGMVDAGPCSFGEASTVIDLTGCCGEEGRNYWKILRAGPVTDAQIVDIIGESRPGEAV